MSFIDEDYHPLNPANWIDCPTCDGEGYIDGEMCEDCNGTGHY